MNHKANATSVIIDVARLDCPIVVEALNITYGDVEVISVSLPGDVSGNVTVTVGNRTFENVPVVNGTVSLAVPDLSVGEYPVTVEYPGDANHNANSASASLTVSKFRPHITIEVADIWYGEVEVLNVTVDVPGTVNVTVNGVTATLVLNGDAEDMLFSAIIYVLKLDNVATWNLYNLAVGQYPAFAVYNGDENYESVNTSDVFNVRAREILINASGEDINVGEDETITINLPANATGNVTVEIDGKNYTAAVKNGKATISIPGLTAGSKVAKVYYSGDGKYPPSENTTEFTVNKIKPDLSASSMNIKVGDDESITVTLPSDATGSVTIIVDGKQYTAPVQNGKAIFNIPGLTAGKYNITAVYDGDDTYMPANGTDKFTVSKVKPDVNVDAPDVKIDENGHVVVTLPSDATGTVTIVIDGKKYTAPVKNGVAVFDIPGLSGGKHDIKVYYSGDDKYSSTETDGDIKVKDKNATHKHEGQSKSEKAVFESTGLENKAAGNPILVLLLAIFALGSAVRFRK